MRKLTPFLFCLGATPALAHAAADDGGLHWNLEVWIIAVLGIACVLYELGWHHMRRRSGAHAAIGLTEAAAFAAGMIALVLALLSPLDGLSEDLFSAHMVQHLTLMLVCAPLFVRSRPLLAFLWALPRRMRKALGHLWGGGGFGRFFKVLTPPICVWIAFCGLFAFWHLPRPYGWALRHEGLHILEHLCLFVSSYAFWSVVIEPSGRRRLDYGATLLFVATAAILSGLPGALMVLTSRPFYAVHAEGAARWGLSLLEDQHLAGLIMWIPAGFVYMAAIAVLFVLWLRAAEHRSAEKLRRLAPVSSAIVLLLAIAGCQEENSLQSTAATPPAAFGNPENGSMLIAQTGCGACHSIPGITGADGLVGPPLDRMGRRIFVAGLLRNTPDNLVLWLRHPQSVVPGNAMPEMGLEEQQARDIAAYLYTLR